MSDHIFVIARSIATAQTIVHQQLYALGDTSHEGAPRECTRPVCIRLRTDAEHLEQLQ